MILFEMDGDGSANDGLLVTPERDQQSLRFSVGHEAQTLDRDAAIRLLLAMADWVRRETPTNVGEHVRIALAIQPACDHASTVKAYSIGNTNAVFESCERCGVAIEGESA